MSVSLFAALTAHFVRENEPNISRAISVFINRKREVVIRDAGKIAKDHELPFIRDELRGLAALDDRTFPGLVKGISNKLSFIQYPDIASYATSDRSPQDHLAALGPKNDIYISIPGLSAKDFAPFPRLLIGSMFVVSELLEQPDLPRARRLFLVDEARVLGGMDVLNDVRDAGRSIGMHLMLIYQNLGQLNEAWGGQAGADAWLDSCEARVVSAVASPRTASDMYAGQPHNPCDHRRQFIAKPGHVSDGRLYGLQRKRATARSAAYDTGSTRATARPWLGDLYPPRQTDPGHQGDLFYPQGYENRVKSPESVQDELDVTRRRKAVLQGMQNKTAAPDTTT